MKKKFTCKSLFILGVILILWQPSIYSQTEEDTLLIENGKLQADSAEDSFQNFIDTLYSSTSEYCDTFGWDNHKINSGRFDSKNMIDTIKILLKDSLGNYKYVSPFQNYITCGFGPRRYIFHYGVDIKLFKGDSVKAAMDGIVRVSKYDRRGYGRVLVLRHHNGLETIYGHLSKTLVETGQVVKAGEVIGLGGNSGRSTGSHLHLEFRYFGEPFDPGCFYDFTEQKLKTDTLTICKTNFEYLIELRKAKYCTIRKGDTLGRLAIRYHTSVRSLCKLNRITPRTLLRIGRKLRYQ